MTGKNSLGIYLEIIFARMVVVSSQTFINQRLALEEAMNSEAAASGSAGLADFMPWDMSRGTSEGQPSPGRPNHNRPRGPNDNLARNFQSRSKVLISLEKTIHEWPRQTKPKKGQFMNFSQGHSGTKSSICESCLFS